MKKNDCSRFVFLVILCVMVLPFPAETGGLGEEGVNLEQVRRLREQTERNTVLSEDVHSRILRLYDISIDALEKASNNRAAVASYERDRGGIERQVQNLRAAVERSDVRSRFELPEKATVSDAEDALARERARLAANRSALRNLERVAEDRSKSRTDISERLGQLDLELELLSDEMRVQADSGGRSELVKAGRLSILARREAILSEVEMLRAKLTLLGDRSVLIPLEIDLAQRRVVLGEELVGTLTEAAHVLRNDQARQSLGRIQEQCRQLSEKLPMLAPLAAETEAMADELWGEDGVIVRSESTVAALAATRSHQSDLNRIAELTARKFQAYGRRGSIASWWPKIPSDFPKPGMVARRIQNLDEEIPEVEYRLITYEQERSAAHDLGRRTMSDLKLELGDQMDSDVTSQVLSLLSIRQDLLDQVILEGGRYSNQLVEYRTLSANFLDRLQEVEHFLYAHALWARSVPKPLVPSFRDIVAAGGWLMPAEHFRSASVVGFDFRGDGLLEALFLIGILFLRQPMRRRLTDIGEHIADPARSGFRFTIEAVVITILLAAPLPIIISIAGRTVGRLGDSIYFISLGSALSELVAIAALFELIRQIFAPKGLAEAHMGWPGHSTQPLHRGLRLIEGVGFPLLLIALHLGFAGFRLNSPDQLQVFNNSLGRVAFIVALGLMGSSILTMLRPAKNLEPSLQGVRVPWPQRFTQYAFPTAFLGAYPIVILATIVPAVLALFGFYITALLLAFQMLRTLLLGVFVLVAGGVFHRWRVVRRNRFLSDQGEGSPQGQPTQEAVASEEQVRQLFRFAIVAVFMVGLFGIWSDALPWLQMLKRVQILPRIELLQAEEAPGGILAIATTAIGEPPEALEHGASAGTDPNADLPGTVGAGAPSDTSQPQSPLILWEIFESMLAAVVTLLLVKNLPGVIEIVLKRRTTLDGGARFAFSTLVRYSITIVGTISVFGLLGVTWGKVQWLAAALTFGLGFGLQEIVANFVSGLILLVERPVRVGDVVTIGTLMGKVSRIQIRATTITLWDRSEMIVPNKEFITTKLVNWTLSDSKRRIEIPLRVAYGADLKEVRKTLVEIAMQHPSVLDDPAPHTLLLGFGEDAIKFELRFVVDFGQGLTTKDQVQMSIESAFREKGIEFALPKSEVRLITGAEKSGERAET